MGDRKRRDVRLIVVTTVTAILMCSAGPSTRPLACDRVGQETGVRLAVAVKRACEDRGIATCEIAGLTRDEVGRHLGHYRILLKVGPGTFDVIAVHRLVRERHRGVPDRTESGFFYLHGSASRFDHLLVSEANLLSYLALRDVDVWGLDARWVQMSREQTEHTAMKDWTFATQVSDALLATRIARHARRLTAQGFTPLNLAGSSLGASLALAVANAEAPMPAGERDVAGLIPMDTIYALPEGAGPVRTLMCANEASLRTAIAGGNYSANALGGIDAGVAALVDPDGYPPNSTRTNRQIALAQGASLTWPSVLPYHNYAISKNADGTPVDGAYTPSEVMFRMMAAFTPWRARATMADYFGVPCGQTDLPYDDHLADITIPVLYIGFAGGFGKEGLHVLDSLGSHDITIRFVQLMSDNEAANDFGHIDWQAATNADEQVWQPIYEWIDARSDCRRGQHGHGKCRHR
jgi:pimeloyl-ACP methyl ester carboxylesterase